MTSSPLPLTLSPDLKVGLLTPKWDGPMTLYLYPLTPREFSMGNQRWEHPTSNSFLFIPSSGFWAFFQCVNPDLHPQLQILLWISDLQTQLTLLHFCSLTPNFTSCAPTTSSCNLQNISLPCLVHSSGSYWRGAAWHPQACPLRTQTQNLDWFSSPHRPVGQPAYANVANPW